MFVWNLCNAIGWVALCITKKTAQNRVFDLISDFELTGAPRTGIEFHEVCYNLAASPLSANIRAPPSRFGTRCSQINHRGSHTTHATTPHTHSAVFAATLDPVQSSRHTCTDSQSTTCCNFTVAHTTERKNATRDGSCLCVNCTNSRVGIHNNSSIDAHQVKGWAQHTLSGTLPAVASACTTTILQTHAQFRHPQPCAPPSLPPSCSWAAELLTSSLLGCCHGCAHCVDLDSGLPPVNSWLDQLHLHPAGRQWSGV